MAEQGTGPDSWAEVYLQGQQEFMRRWGQMGGAAAGAGTASGGMPDWSTLFASQLHGPAADVARKYFALYEQYLGSTRGISELLGRAMQHADPAARARTFTEGVTTLQQPFTQLWTSMLNANFGATSPFGAASPFGTASPLGGDWAPGASDAPALGLTRERQQAMQRLQRLSAEYLQHQSTLARMWNEIIGAALKTLGERVGEKLQRGESFESLKPLYDTWIESAESAYAKAAHNPDYARAQVDLSTTLARLRTEQRQMIESVAKQYDLPTREELNTVHRRLKDLKTEVRRLSAKLDKQKKLK